MTDGGLFISLSVVFITMSDLNQEAIKTNDDGNLRPKFETSYKLNEYFQGLIQFSDQKASFIISLSLGLLAGNLAIISYNITNLKSLLISFQFKDGVILSLYLVLILAIIILQWLVFNNAISVVTPSITNQSKKTSIFFFGEVASLNHEDFQKKLLDKKESEVLDDLIYQIYDKACIAKIKFQLVTKSTTILKLLLILTIAHPFINILLNLF